MSEMTVLHSQHLGCALRMQVQVTEDGIITTGGVNTKCTASVSEQEEVPGLLQGDYTEHYPK